MNNDYRGSTAELDFNFSDTLEGVKLEMAIANRTARDLGSALVGVGFDLPDFVKSFKYDRGTSTYGQVYRNAALPPFSWTFDLGVRSRNMQPSGNPEDNTFAGGNPIAGLLPGQTTKISWFVNAGDLNARALEDYMYRAYLNQNLRAAGRFEQVGSQGQGKDRVLGVIKFVQPPQEVPEPGGWLGLTAISAAIALYGGRGGRKKAKLVRCSQR
ncbi:hypothetical protein [Oscillatoria sp. FACHB-1406]|uniref:hypothetical protein n=1 Tax=Oscillatoria sp. FACHB-1406 TaxID=2692846 RepID=UPI001684F94F|nr:hypothetical protein [Oscillatoria sp. FACHB-1406]